MIIIIGPLEAVRKAAVERQIPLPVPGTAPASGSLLAPFTRRRLADLRAGRIFYGFGSNPGQAVMVAEPEKETPVKLVFPDSDGDTEISLHDDGLENFSLPDLLASVSSLKMLKDPWRGRNLDIEA